MNFNSKEEFPHRQPLDICDAIKHVVKDKVVCDLGCGAGDLLAYLKDRNLCKEVIGIEISPERYKKANNALRHYIKFGDLLDMELPNADIYFLWVDANFPYEKIFDKIKKQKIIIYGDGSEDNHKKFQQYKGIELLESITYKYDESQFISKNRMEIYLKNLKKLQEINSSWTIIGSRICKIYRYSPLL